MHTIKLKSTLFVLTKQHGIKALSQLIVFGMVGGVRNYWKRPLDVLVVVLKYNEAKFYGHNFKGLIRIKAAQITNLIPRPCILHALQFSARVYLTISYFLIVHPGTLAPQLLISALRFFALRAPGRDFCPTIRALLRLKYIVYYDLLFKWSYCLSHEGWPPGHAIGPFHSVY